MSKLSRLIVDAMLKEAADAITRNTSMLAQISREGDSIILELDDPPHSQLTLQVKSD